MLPLIFLLVFASPVQALPVSYALEGLMADGGRISGSLSYDTDTSPLALNMRGLAGNASYLLSDYTITVAPVYSGIAPVLYQPGVGNVEFCQGHCVFASNDVSNLRLTDGIHTLQLTFAPQWAGFLSNSSDYRMPQANGIDQIVMVVRSAAMVPVSVPEPMTWLLLALGLVGIMLFKRRLS